MRILIFHGYLLSGTGSNVYNASLAAAMRRMGHEVHLICQDRRAGELDFVDAVGEWDASGALAVRRAGSAPVADSSAGRVNPQPPPASQGRDASAVANSPAERANQQPVPAASPEGGSVTAYVPDIGGILPVFVHDRYAGFEVKTYSELTDAELERYIERNVAAVRNVVALAGPPDAALANHLVTAPLVLDRAGIPFAVKVHGSDLSYTVLPDMDRYGPMAAEGARAAQGILVGSQHIADRLREAVDEPEVNAKVRQGPPGVDTDLFAPTERDHASARLRSLAGHLDATTDDSEPGSSWARDPAEAAAAVRHLADTEPDAGRVVFVGKLIVSKGVDLLVAAWPLVNAAHPGARLLIAGFGAYRDGLEQLIAALGEGDLEAALALAAKGRALEGGGVKPLRHLTAFLSDPPAGYGEDAQAAAGSIALAGRLEHSEVGQLVPAADALVFPSTHPEAFGMVAAEAAAASVLPVSAAHSGALEVSRELANDLPASAKRLVSFPVDDDAVTAIANRLIAWLDLDTSTRAAAREALRATATRIWSWEGVAQKAIEASRGEG